jgi:hypothetical protein
LLQLLLLAVAVVVAPPLPSRSLRLSLSSFNCIHQT